MVHARTPSIAECAAIDVDSERLACYDQVSGRAGPAQPAAPLPPSNAEKSAAGRPPAAPAGEGAPPTPTHAIAKAESPTEFTTPSLIDGAWAFDPSTDPYAIKLYQPNYFLFARYSDHVNNQPFTPLFQAANLPNQGLDNVEAKFQLSFKVRLWTTGDRRWGAWVAYTQQSNWQVYNSDISRPFRETDYMPEVLASYRPGLKLGGFQWNLLNVGYNHESNGRSDLLSRSWDRIFAQFGIERGNLALMAKVWYPFNYDQDNPDIVDYYGYGSIAAIYQWHDHSFTLTARGNLSQGKGAVQLTWMSPKLLGPLRAYVQGFSGYGESLIDYNWSQNTIGFGVALNDML
jgi:phospholipase A1